jgi:phosphomannomutase
MTDLDARTATVTPLRLKASADGWRGLIGGAFTARAAAILTACGVEAVARDHGPCSVLITHDGRAGGEEAAAEAARSAAAAGARRVRLAPHLPTPVMATAVRLGHAELAVSITASHNPPQWNGVKFKTTPGCPPPPELEADIDRHFAQRIAAGGGDAPTPIRITPERPEPYLEEHIAEALKHLERRQTRPLRAVVDGLSGIAGDAVARLCERLGWTVRRVGCRPDPEFGGLAPDPSLPTSRTRLAACVRAVHADLGIVLDGDGDRIYVLDERSRTILPHELLALLLEHRHRNGRLHPGSGVAVTSSAGTAIHEAARRLGVPLREVRIGFKHLSPLLAADRVDLAGGSVGDISCAEFGPDRDPFAAVVLLADLLADSDGTLADLVDDLRARIGPLTWFEARVETRTVDDALSAVGCRALADCGLAGSIGAVTDVDGVKFWLDRGQWILLRASTTEGGVRLYGELGDPRAAETLPARIARLLTDGTERTSRGDQMPGPEHPAFSRSHPLRST